MDVMVRRGLQGPTLHATRLLVSERPVNWPSRLQVGMKAQGNQLLALLRNIYEIILPIQ